MPPARVEPAVAVEARAPVRRRVDVARTGIDDQALARGRADDLRVPSRMTVGVAVLAVELLELVPDGLLVREPDAPLNVDERSGVAASFDVVAELQRATFRTVVVVNPHLKARRLPADATFAGLVVDDVNLGEAVGRHERVAEDVALGRRLGRLLRRDVEGVGTVAEARYSDSGMNAIDG